MLEAMRRDERRSQQADRLLTWPERVLRAAVYALWFASFFVVWTIRGDLSMPWLLAVVGTWFVISAGAFAAFVVYQRNRARRRAREARAQTRRRPVDP